MITAIIVSFVVGVWFGNGIPHFVRGITKQSYPSALAIRRSLTLSRVGPR